MRKQLFIFLAVFGWIVPCAGQERDASTAGSPLESGSWALQFRIAENFTLANFPDTGIALKRHFTPGSAVRLGVNLDINSSNLESAQDTLAVRTDSNGERFDIQLQYLWYPSSTSRVNFFVGAGPVFGLVQTKETREGSATESVTDNDVWLAGLAGMLGVEWFATKHIGIHSEYGLAWRYFSVDRTRTLTAQPATTSKSTGWRFGFGSVLFGISAYF